MYITYHDHTKIRNYIILFLIIFSIYELYIISTFQDLQNSKPKIIEKVITRNFQIEFINNCTITSYSGNPNETDGDPYTALMEFPISGGTCAVSRDLMYWLGGKIYIEGIGIRRVNDLMHSRHTTTVDLFNGNTKAALKFGKKQRSVVYLGKE
jgi:3D (Asp-Asp-Asp) domain-containing protein